MKKNTIIVSLVLLASLGAAIALLGRDKGSPQNPASIVAPSRLRAEGRVVAYPGSDVSVGTDLGGTLLEVRVQEGDEVRKGQVLALIDARQEKAALEEARSRVRESEADTRFLETELRRNETLQTDGIISRQSLDQARNQLELAKARRDAAQATAERLRVTLSKLQILAPLNGQLVTRLVQGGETVAAGTKLFQIVQTDRVRVEAEIDEFDLTHIALDSPVVLRAEGCEQSWKGAVEEIPNQVVGRRLKPQDPARPSDTRVLMVKVALKEKTPLKLGQRVELEIEPQKSNGR